MPATATLAFPDDDPHGATTRYQRSGLAATMAALAGNGPLRPAPYVPTATQRREHTNARVYAGRVAFITACHLPTATPTRTATR